jgi:hypothetical protein
VFVFVFENISNLSLSGIINIYIFSVSHIVVFHNSSIIYKQKEVQISIVNNKMSVKFYPSSSMPY